MEEKSMFKIVAAVSLSVGIVGSATAAGGWVLAGDSRDSNSRYLVDTRNVEQKVNKHGVNIVTAPVRSITNGADKVGYAVLDAQGCVEGGGSLAIAFGDDVNRLWWSVSGGRVYDQIGGTICSIQMTQAELGNREGKRSPTSTASNQAERSVYEFSKRKPPAVFERVRNTMADAIEANNALTLDQAYVIAVANHYTVTADNYRQLGLSEIDYKLLITSNSI